MSNYLLYRGMRKAAFPCIAAGIGVFLLTVQACTVTDPSGRKWQVAPAEPPNGPIRGVVVGTFVGPDGKTYKLVDFNGDCVPDFAQSPDGEYRKITPIDEPIPTQPPTGTEQVSGGGHPVDPEPWNSFWSDHVDWDAGISPPMPFDFGSLDASDWISYYGMNIPAGQTAITTGLRLYLFDASTLYTDAVFYTSSNFIIPEVDDFVLDYEFYGMLGEQDDPDFMVMRIAGDLSEVIKFAFEIGDGVQQFGFTESGISWNVVADEETMTATLYRNGLFYSSMPIN